jgi:Aminotransferase class-V
MYANTHTEASATGRWTTELREQARAIIHRAVNGGPDDVVVFCGAGATGAIDKLIRMLELERGQRPVVFIGPYEHHSNELPWRESVADVVTIRDDDEGRVDVEHLEHELRRHSDRRVKIGSFSAASNVTGIVTEVAHRVGEAEEAAGRPRDRARSLSGQVQRRRAAPARALSPALARGRAGGRPARGRRLARRRRRVMELRVDRGRWRRCAANCSSRETSPPAAPRAGRRDAAWSIAVAGQQLGTTLRPRC